MAKRFLKKIMHLGGVDVQRYDLRLNDYRELYEKYRQYTMIHEDAFVSNLDLVSRFLKNDGAIVECGVWRGGMSAAIAELSVPTRKIHLFDSFEGLPPAKDIDGKDALTWQNNVTSTEYFDNCTAEESFAIEAMKLSNHNHYEIHRGWFNTTLPKYNEAIAILRLDCDWYDSVKECMDKLFPLVLPGGLIIIDDYYTWEGCAKAVHDYLSEIKSPSRIHQWNNQFAYLIKQSN
jgi:O-methyltransferase